MAVSLVSAGVTFPDGTTQATAAGAVTTTAVLNATAGASAGAVGTYAWAGTVNSGSRTAFGSTLAGSTLYSQGIVATMGSIYSCATSGETVLSGTWRCMGYKPSNEVLESSPGNRNMTLWLRIS